VHREPHGADPRRRRRRLHRHDTERKACDRQRIQRGVRRKVAQLRGGGEKDERERAREEEEEAALGVLVVCSVLQR
jgi:hypothetical protein